MKKKHIFAILYALILTAFTVYVVLDTFVITRVYGEVSAITASSLTSSAEIDTETHTAAASSNESSTPAAASDSHKSSKGRPGSSHGPGSSSGGHRKSSVSETASEDSVAQNTEGYSESQTIGGSSSAYQAQSTDSASSQEASGGSTSADANAASQSAGTDASTSASTQTSTVSTATSYQDENITITLSEYTVSDTTVYVADIQLSTDDLLKTALAHNAYGRNVTQKTSEMAEENNAILAINGDYYGTQETGYVLRNGVLLRSTAEAGQEDLVIWGDGSFSIINESEVTAEELLAQGAVQILSFGPALVTDGEVAVSAGEEVGKAMASNPRTAIGIVEEGHYLFVVSDGRTEESEGLSLSELASFLKTLGAETAYNLDGGGSSTMYFNGEIVNNPTTTGNSVKERSVSDIVYIGY